MRKFLPPKLDKTVACIVSSEADLELVARVSCYLNKSDMYVPMFRLPAAEYKQDNDFSVSNDSFFSDLLVSKATTLILNSITRINCRRVILIGMDDKQKSFLKIERYYKVEFIEINTLTNLDNKLKFLNRTFEGEYYCNKTDILKGLAQAIKSNKLLIVDESVSALSDFYNHTGEGIVVVEFEGDISEVFIVNYACSIKADIKFVQPYDHTELRDIKQKLYKWKREGSYGAYLSCNSAILDSVADIKFDTYKFATFFTDGIPYGVILNEQVPCSHVLRSVNVDIFIFNNILYEQSSFHLGSALIFSPQPEDLGEHTKAEVGLANKMLTEMNMFVKNLVEKQATVKAFDNYVGQYPFDILHICSHGGKFDGYYVIQEFADRDGNQHVIEFEEIVGFSPDKGNYVNVTSKKIFRYFDGFVWRSEELAKQEYPQYVYKDLCKALRADEANITRKRVDYLIEDSCHVQCYDDIHQGQFNSIASQGLPVIFNNSCTSWEEFALHVIAAGCRAYIGTLWNINNEIASQSSSLFYSHVFNTTILEAVQGMLSSIDNEKYKDIYIFCGLHFSTIKKGASNSKDNVREELLIALDRWVRYTMEKRAVELLDSALKVIKFLNRELTSYYTNPEVMKALVGSALVINELEEKLKSLEQG